MKHSVGFVCSGLAFGVILALTYSRGEGHGRQAQSARRDASSSTFSVHVVKAPGSTREGTYLSDWPRGATSPSVLGGGQAAIISRPETTSNGLGGDNTPHSAPPEPLSANLVDSFDLKGKCRRVAADLVGEESRSRQDLLAMYGRAAAASGCFDMAAAAYAMFLDEFGTEHPYSCQIAMHLADCLAPLDLDSIDIAHTAEGPKFNPQWRMGHSVSRDRLQHAVAAYTLAADLSATKAGTGRALLRIGWIYRALNDWSASTNAWDRCAAQAAGTKSGGDALWLAAENLAWTGDAIAAAQRLQKMAAEYPADARVTSIADRIENLQADASRTPGWLANPVASLEAEIEARSAVRTPSEVYRSAVRWLRQSRERAAAIAIGRWACGQADWAAEDQIACRYDLIDVLLLTPQDDVVAEVIGLLREIADLAPSDAGAVSAAIRRSRLLHELGHFDEVDQTFKQILARVRGSPRWEPIVLSEQIESLLKRGERNRAKTVLDILVESYPDFDVSERFDGAFPSVEKERSK